jgi:molecular chaperone GrpE (heat shock protein)
LEDRTPVEEGQPGESLDAGAEPVTEGSQASVAEEIAPVLATEESVGEAAPEEGSASREDPGEEPESADQATGAETDAAGASDTVPIAVLERLEARLDNAVALAQRRDDLVDLLHKENQQLRQGELHSAMLPLVRDLMRLHDDLERIIEVDPDVGDAVLIRDALSDALARNGIVKFLPSLAEPFDAIRHGAVGTEPTGDPERDRTIAAARRAGFRRDDGSIVRVADVIVCKYTAIAANRPPTSVLAEDQRQGDPEQNHDKEGS